MKKVTLVLAFAALIASCTTSSEECESTVDSTTVSGVDSSVVTTTLEAPAVDSVKADSTTK